MKKFSSFKKQQKLFENWRQFTEAKIDWDKYKDYDHYDDQEHIDNPDLIQPEPEDRVPKPGDDDYVSDFTGIPGAPEQDEDLSEDFEKDPEVIRILQQISKQLDTLEDIDTSIDYLASALSGEDAHVMKAKQGMLGRFAQARAPASPLPIAEKTVLRTIEEKLTNLSKGIKK
jgi:hypothetical protein